MFDPSACLEDISRYGVTTMFGVPAMFLFLSQLPEFDAADLTSVRTLVCGGAPVPEPLIKLFNGEGPHQSGLRIDRDRTHGQLPVTGVVTGKDRLCGTSPPLRRDPRG